MDIGARYPQRCVIPYLWAGIALLMPGTSVADAQNVHSKASSSVVDVEAMLPTFGDLSPQAISRGSGVFVSEEHIVTNCHVIAGAITVRVQTTQGAIRATLNAVDLDADLCLLKADPSFNPSEDGSLYEWAAGAPDEPTGDLNIEPVNLRTEPPSPGEPVYAVGSPRGLTASVSDGIVSGLRRDEHGVPLIQTTAPIAPGSSGGGLFDAEGDLVGITSFYFGPETSINFAVEANRIHNLQEKDFPTHEFFVQRYNNLPMDRVLSDSNVHPGNDLLILYGLWLLAEPSASTIQYLFADVLAERRGDYAAAYRWGRFATRSEQDNPRAWMTLGDIVASMDNLETVTITASEAYLRAYESRNTDSAKKFGGQQVLARMLHLRLCRVGRTNIAADLLREYPDVMNAGRESSHVTPKPEEPCPAIR